MTTKNETPTKETSMIRSKVMQTEYMLQDKELEFVKENLYYDIMKHLKKEWSQQWNLFRIEFDINQKFMDYRPYYIHEAKGWLIRDFPKDLSKKNTWQKIKEIFSF